MAVVLGTALILGVMAGGAAPRTGTMRIPVEVEIEPGAVSCTPADDRFERGFRTALGDRQLAVSGGGRASRAIVNDFCFASERPDVSPLHIRVRIRCDAGADYDYVRPDSSAIRTADHWLVHVSVPARGNPLVPRPWQRTSLWARSDREGYCANMGRVIALCVLEALSHRSGRIAREERLDLGPGVSRDAKYSECK